MPYRLPSWSAAKEFSSLPCRSRGSCAFRRCSYPALVTCCRETLVGTPLLIILFLGQGGKLFPRRKCCCEVPGRPPLGAILLCHNIALQMPRGAKESKSSATMVAARHLTDHIGVSLLELKITVSSRLESAAKCHLGAFPRRGALPRDLLEVPSPWKCWSITVGAPLFATLLLGQGGRLSFPISLLAATEKPCLLLSLIALPRCCHTSPCCHLFTRALSRIGDSITATHPPALGGPSPLDIVGAA